MPVVPQVRLTADSAGRRGPSRSPPRSCTATGTCVAARCGTSNEIGRARVGKGCGVQTCALPIFLQPHAVFRTFGEEREQGVRDGHTQYVYQVCPWFRKCGLRLIRRAVEAPADHPRVLVLPQVLAWRRGAELRTRSEERV